MMFKEGKVTFVNENACNQLEYCKRSWLDLLNYKEHKSQIWYMYTEDEPVYNFKI